jgi:hypothetical protein|tara:strand:- start:394 stop:999 length:606 start_codon:yes stop_codon:yes gene_type:complete
MSHFSLIPLTELEAVNDLLAAIGESSVSSIETVTTVDVTQAKRTLSQINREVQQKGWHFNTEWDVTLSLDSDNRLPLGTNVLSAYSPTNLATMRGRSGTMYLYDLNDNTFTWTKAITDLVVIKLLDFQDLPQTARRYITTKAARVFQEEIIGQTTAETVNRQEEVEAYADMLDDESERSGFNVGWGSIDMINTVRRHRKLW